MYKCHLHSFSCKLKLGILDMFFFFLLLFFLPFLLRLKFEKQKIPCVLLIHSPNAGIRQSWSQKPGKHPALLPLGIKPCGAWVS